MSFLRLDNYTVPGFGLIASLSMPFEDEDASGESSNTAKASKGIKAKKLDCKTFLRFTQEAELRRLTMIAQQRVNGDNQIYTLTNRTANAAGMRQARFTGDFRVDEQEDRQCWLVSFSLAEHISIPERAEARTEKKALPSSTTQEQPGEVVEAEQQTKPEQELSWGERFIKGVNDWIGSLDDDEADQKDKAENNIETAPPKQGGAA